MADWLFDRVAPAPAWIALLSLTMYIYLSYAAFSHMSKGFLGGFKPSSQLHFDISMLTGTYAVETIVAVGFGLSPLAGWRKFDYLTHHLPFVFVGVLALTPVGLNCGEGLVQLWPITLVFDIATSPNEANSPIFFFGLLFLC